MAEVDFVITWVDGNDPEWQKRKAGVAGKAGAAGDAPEDDRAERYRDWDLLRYWFRGVERFAPWVRQVFFVCGQEPPAWLRTDHPKLRVVRHGEFIPERFLPTFSSHPIELNMHRIPGLGEKFVYFNDDMFLIRPVPEERFFYKGLPRDSALLNPVPTTDLRDREGGRIFTVPLNNAEYLNRDYSFRECIRKHPLKWLTPRYGAGALRNLLLFAWPRFVGFDETHLPQPFLKASFAAAWERDGDILEETCGHALRNDRDVNPWLIRHAQMAEGTFRPVRPEKQAVFHLSRDGERAAAAVRAQKRNMVCLNDDLPDSGRFEEIRKGLEESFRRILPERSGFEREAGSGR